MALYAIQIESRFNGNTLSTFAVRACGKAHARNKARTIWDMENGRVNVFFRVWPINAIGAPLGELEVRTCRDHIKFE